MPNTRLRDLDIVIGTYKPGAHNAITDVPGVLVGHTTLIYDEPRVARTGVTIILPRAEGIWHNGVFAAYHAFNGAGEMTGVHWLAETGMLTTPIGITNTHQVGTVHEAITAYGEASEDIQGSFALPVVAETYDGRLNDIGAFHVKQEHVFAALDAASDGPVAEGNVGGGTGMICHEFKGGIGTASRSVTIAAEDYTLGVLVQTNYGDRKFLRIDGVPVGKEIGIEKVPSAWGDWATGTSIIVVIATDAPLLPIQCKRLAQRATVGLARTGGIGHNRSGDIFLAFSTGNDVRPNAESETRLRMLPNQMMNPIFEAAAEAVEEAILNALVAAETMEGYQGRIAHALPLDELQAVMKKYRP